MTFILDEDSALRNALKGMVVHDQISDAAGTPRPVRVWFGQPDQELTEQLYPYVVIDLINIERDPTRESRGWTTAPYLKPEVMVQNTDFEADIPIPVNLDYQITTFSRNPYHDRQILTQINFQKIPQRFGILNLNDGTVRRMDVMAYAKRDAVEQAKRLFVNVITVRVSSEVSRGTLRVLNKVLQVNLDELSSTNAGGRPGDPAFTGVEPFTIQ